MVGLRRKVREFVSKKKRRFRDATFDLDLTYVTPRVIAMGAPCEGVEAVYRNDVSEVQEFLEVRHADHYKVINLCSEREASPHFPNIERFPFDDHTPCPLEVLVRICRSIEEFLREDPDNVVAIHCKAGKGRTGLVVCCFLQHCHLCGTPDEALTLFGERRTTNGKGVTIPSQIRYVNYYGQLLRSGAAAKAPPALYRLRRVRLMTMPCLGIGLSSTVELFFTVRLWRERADRMVLTYDYSTTDEGAKKVSMDDHIVDLDCEEVGVRLFGDVHIAICTYGHTGKVEEICSIWLNTRFCGDKDGLLCFSKADIDGASKDKKGRFSEDFEVQLRLEKLEDPEEDAPPVAKTLTSVIHMPSMVSEVECTNCCGWWETDEDTESESSPGSENP